MRKLLFSIAALFPALRSAKGVIISNGCPNRLCFRRPRFPPFVRCCLIIFFILAALPLSGATAPTVASLSTNPKRINESVEAHSSIRSPLANGVPPGTWSPNVQVNDDAGTADQWFPNIAVDPAGNAYAVWQDYRNGNWDIYFAYRPVGGSWGTNVKINDGPGASIRFQYQPGIAVDREGNAYAVWMDHRSGNWGIYFSYRPAGASWGSNVQVNDDAGTTEQWEPAIAVDADGNAYAVWVDHRSGNWGIYFSYRPAGGNWGANTKVNDRGLGCNPAIAVDPSGNAYAVWRDARDDNNGDIYFAYRPAGGSWGTNVKVNDDTIRAGQLEPAIAVDPSGNAYAVWADSRNGPPFDIYFAYRPAGGNWGPNVKLNDDVEAAEHSWPAITVDVFGNAYAIWDDNRSGRYHVYFAYRPAGGSWGTNVRVDDSTGGAWLSGIAMDASGNAYAVWQDSRNGNSDIYFSYRPARGGPGLSIAHIEVTQAIQDETNSVPLIADKPTFVRVYMDCGVGCTSLPDVTGVLRGYGPSGELTGSPLSPTNRSITAYHDNWQNQRDDLHKTLNFTLPLDWRTETITLTAEISGATRSEVVTFESAQTPNIIYVPIRYKGQSPDIARIRNGSWWAFRVYPTSRIDYVPGTTLDWNRCLEKDLLCPFRDRNTKSLLNELTTRYRLVNAYVYGWLPEGTFGGGISDPTWYGGAGKAAFGDDHSGEGPRIFAHEIVHLMGRRHTNSSSCHPDKIDPQTDWPWVETNSLIQDYGLDGYGFGWLVSSSSAVKNPANTYDYMSYCGSLADDNVWTSSWTYEHIYSETLKLQTTTPAVHPLAAPQAYFIASGLVYTDDTATLDPIWVITSTVEPENPPAGTTYCLEAQDTFGTPLVSHCFDLTFMNYETGEATDVDGFNLMLPYPDGVARIVLKKGTTELAVQLVSANAPVVTVLSPNGGETWAASGTYTITWTANDPDDDPLTYSVLYSPDGSDWMPIGATITQTQLTVNAAELPGSTNARIRVLASDSVNTSADESDAPFTVGHKPPQAFIISPEADSATLANTPVLLEGYAYDLEDGTLGDATLSWASSRDGSLGTGAQVLTTLSLGQHTLTFTATDSDGNTATATVQVIATFPEDVVPDCQVDIADIMQVASRWRTSCDNRDPDNNLDTPNYEARYDLDHDCDIDIVDIMKVAAHWGETCGTSAAELPLTLGGLKASAQNPTVRLDPQNSTVGLGDTFTVTVIVDDALDLGSFQFDLAYDPSVIWVDDVTLGDFLGSTGRSVVSLIKMNNGAGTTTFGAFSFGDQPGPDGLGALALVRLKAVGPGSSPLDLQDVQLTDTKANPQTPTVEDGTVTVSSTEGWHRGYTCPSS